MGLIIPEKGPDVTWTDEQWKAIWATGQDTLVSAAAGSGKTAVLINRMIEKTISSENPIDVDELLVVTFTNASAAEMRHRMAEALEKEIAKNPNNQHLRRQLSLVNKAQISTLHSFCLAIVRQYAYLIDIDPGFRIANEGESALLRDDVLAEVLEEAYDQKDEEKVNAVYRLVDSFTSDRDDQAIETLIDKLYDTSRVHPEPTKWLRSLSQQYDLPDNITIDELDFIEPLKNSIKFSLEEALAHIEEVRQYALKPDGPYNYGETARLDTELLEEARRILSHGTWQEAYDFFNALKWSTLARMPKDSCDPELQKKAKKKRDQAKDVVKQLKESFFLRKPERLLQEIRLMAPIIDTLVELTESFSEKFKAAKLQRGLVDFSDLEHYALDILTVEEEGVLRPSPVALDFKEKFKEVLVDEYQDTNMLQETILQLVKSGTEIDGNMFMVGDVKQSIYRFRLAEPMLFLNKYNQFDEEADTNGLKIDLNANFRSRKEVLHGTNFVFEQIMGKTVGEIHYDEKAGLKPGAPYNDVEMPIELAILYEEQEDSQVTEEAEMETPIDEEIKKSQAEARFIIKRIRELIDGGATVYDAKQKDPSKRIRPMRYSDIVILMRSMTWSNDLVEEFKSAGIPLYAESSKGYFEALEVMVMLNVLKIIDNPYQDIPLASVLRAPFIGCTENELAKIRLADRKAPYYDAVKQFVEEGHSGLDIDTAVKLQRFLAQLDTWRNLARRGSLSDLIWKIYIDTNYYEMVGAMTNGKQRQANLRTLHDRALMYEKTSFRGLFRFLRFIDRIRSRGDDLGVAKSIGEKDDVVRLVTIHSSKGLEYPVVFVAGLGRNFNQMDFSNPYLFDQQFGLAVKAIDPDDRIMYTSLPFLAMKEKKTLELKAEEMRVLYVAMTRAKERLILVGSVKDWEKVRSTWCEVQHLPTDVMLPEYLRARAKNYLDWIGPAVARHESFVPFSDAEYRPIDHPTKWVVTLISNTFFMNTLYSQENDVLAEEEEHEVDEGLLSKLTNRFTSPYAYRNAVTKSSKTSVSEIKRIENLQRAEETETKVMNSTVTSAQKRPQFLQAKKLSATEIGTVVHTVMQHAPKEGFSTIAEVGDYLNVLVERDLLTVDEIQVVDPQKVVQFFFSNIGQRFSRSKQLHREIPFTLSIVDEEGDSQIVQGILDCLFEDEQGKWVLLDYKTDKILPSFSEEPYLTNEMKKRYGVQLRNYSEAIETILQVKVDEKVLYLYNAEKEIVLE
ncbi:helicase-exonuclease AddAB subunit AddA [Ureibacillus sinduriensis]|uniref:ATP-dependent helicase/nuclease subunit A n=1 Tax=Ureibacillus sinduriensis BLB-1 = JCM 15800 TaxID=1384057 RepID=A0A0A3HV12_9BACL|nr:helicase-exonuclease AddAB subunit AddA [Ureibacillus sinduriensis]KGR76426.1 ATP-dependent helicase [Ureibacillus sinduriensis BLB-1 = JCM 15800]